MVFGGHGRVLGAHGPVLCAHDRDFGANGCALGHYGRFFALMVATLPLMVASFAFIVASSPLMVFPRRSWSRPSRVLPRPRFSLIIPFFMGALRVHGSRFHCDIWTLICLVFGDKFIHVSFLK